VTTIWAGLAATFGYQSQSGMKRIGFPDQAIAGLELLLHWVYPLYVCRIAALIQYTHTYIRVGHQQVRKLETQTTTQLSASSFGHSLSICKDSRNNSVNLRSEPPDVSTTKSDDSTNRRTQSAVTDMRLMLKNAIFGFLQKSVPVKIWLYEQTSARIEGTIRGFDEFMNIVVDNAISVELVPGDASQNRRQLGRILLKGDNISLIQALV
jgi:small nuclear ribonucleoprotein E